MQRRLNRTMSPESRPGGRWAVFREKASFGDAGGGGASAFAEEGFGCDIAEQVRRLPHEERGDWGPDGSAE